MPAKNVNDEAFCLIKRGALETFAGKPAPTGDCGAIFQGCSWQPWRSPIHTALLLRPMPLTVTRLLAVSSVKPLMGNHCFT